MNRKEKNQIEADLVWLAKNDEVVKRHKDLSADVKDRMKTEGVGEHEFGSFQVTVETRPRSSFNIPPEIKEKYKGEPVDVTYVTWKQKLDRNR